MEITIIHEDAYCLIINKPNNVLVHNSYYARNIKDPSLIELIQEQYDIKVYPLHRLDRKTSGLLVLLKDSKRFCSSERVLFSAKALS